MRSPLLNHCRKVNNISYKKIANRLGISIADYKKVECGEYLLVHKDSRKLAALFKVKWPIIHFEISQNFYLKQLAQI